MHALEFLIRKFIIIVVALVEVQLVLIAHHQMIFQHGEYPHVSSSWSDFERRMDNIHTDAHQLV